MGTASQKIKVFEINTSFAYAGAQRTMLSFCRYFDRNIFDLFAVSYGEGGPRESEFTRLGIKTYVAHGDVSGIFSLAEQEQPAVIHIHRSGGPHLLEQKLLLGLRERLPDAAIVETNVFGQYDHVAGGVIDVHLLKSKMMLNERFVPALGGKDTYNPKRMRVVYNPVDCASFEPYRLTPEQIVTYKNTLGIPDNHLVIGRIGRPDITKWSDLLLEMLPLLLRENPNITCLIQDLPPSRKSWVTKAWWGDRVMIIPETSSEADVHRFYQTIDILTHTSKIGEAFGNTINEAMYWQKPVITHSTPQKDNGQVEQVDHGENGYLANTPEQMAAAVIFLDKHREKIQALGSAGKRKVTKQYDPRAMTIQVEKTFIEVLHDKAHPVLQDSQWRSLPQVYAKTPWSPSEMVIREYREQYRERLNGVFTEYQVKTHVFRTCRRVVRRLLWKVRDYMATRHWLFFR